MKRIWRLSALVAAVVLVFTSCTPPIGTLGGHHPPAPPPTRLLPIVFVHGQTGSAQQFETQAMRFTSNGYPQNLLYTFEYNTSLSTNPLGDLDAFIDHVRAETGAPQVYAIGHSRGTSVWTGYLDPTQGPPGASAKVAKYVNIDGASPSELPGGVPTIGIWGEWNSAGSPYNRRGGTDAQIGPNPADNFHFPDKSHTETATSAETFAIEYKFLTGKAPITTDVRPEPPGQVTVAGRAVVFPDNSGLAGATVQVWMLDDSGHRIGSHPRYSYTVGASGDFGPVKVNSRHRYEFAVVQPDGLVSHLYPEPLIRTDHFLRLNTAPKGGALDSITPDSPQTTNLVVLRNREFWGDQGTNSDKLLVNGTNVLTPAISPRTGVNLAVFVQDDGLDGQTDLGKGELSPFNLVTFLTAVDVAIPASAQGSGTVTVTEVPRGGGPAATIKVPNWPSSTQPITIQFRDYHQANQSFP